MVLDGFGRAIDYLRISLTDRCNLRCRYCMPIDGLHFAPEPELLTAEEIQTVVQAAAGLGFRKVRLTGGEPTLRADVVDITARIKAVPGIRDVSMTTNAIRMPSLAMALKSAGLDRVNVHVDALAADRVADLMRWGSADALWAGVAACEAAGLAPIKLNVVVTRGYNDDPAELAALAALSCSKPWTVRFIELMPLGAGEESDFAIDHYVPNDRVRERIEAALGPLLPVPNADPSDEASNFRFAGAPGGVGFISPVSAPYCGTCNRMRMTADGRFHLCLLHDDELDVREVLRGDHPSANARRAAVAAVLERAVAAKPTGHALRQGIYTELRRMHAIGG